MTSPVNEDDLTDGPVLSGHEASEHRNDPYPAQNLQKAVPVSDFPAGFVSNTEIAHSAKQCFSDLLPSTKTKKRFPRKLLVTRKLQRHTQKLLVTTGETTPSETIPDLLRLTKTKLDKELNSLKFPALPLSQKSVETLRSLLESEDHLLLTYVFYTQLSIQPCLYLNLYTAF